MKKARAVCIALWICLTAVASGSPAEEKQVVGWLERIRICPEDLGLRAKLDTGARHSSLHAARVEFFQRDGETWVRFDVTDRKGKSAVIERRLHRMARIKQHDRPSALRPVVQLILCLGDCCRTAEVNIKDRSHFNYEMLIGRSFLREGFIVDPSVKLTMRSSCQRARNH